VDTRNTDWHQIASRVLDFDLDLDLETAEDNNTDAVTSSEVKFR